MRIIHMGFVACVIGLGRIQSGVCYWVGPDPNCKVARDWEKENKTLGIEKKVSPACSVISSTCFQWRRLLHRFPTPIHLPPIRRRPLTAADVAVVVKIESLRSRSGKSLVLWKSDAINIAAATTTTPPHRPNLLGFGLLLYWICLCC